MQAPGQFEEKHECVLTFCSRFCRGSCRSWCSTSGRFPPMPRHSTSTWGNRCANTDPLRATAIFLLFDRRNRRTAGSPLVRLGLLLAATEKKRIFYIYMYNNLQIKTFLTYIIIELSLFRMEWIQIFHIQISLALKKKWKILKEILYNRIDNFSVWNFLLEKSK